MTNILTQAQYIKNSGIKFNNGGTSSALDNQYPNSRNLVVDPKRLNQQFRTLDLTLPSGKDTQNPLIQA